MINSVQIPQIWADNSTQNQISILSCRETLTIDGSMSIIAVNVGNQYLLSYKVKSPLQDAGI